MATDPEPNKIKTHHASTLPRKGVFLFSVTPLHKTQHMSPQGDNTSTKPQCYYEILNVERNADVATIKKAHRKAALQWHPDKNNNSDESTHKFRLIQQAYECLSDPVERKWYDEHREGILQGFDPNDGSSFSAAGNISFLFNVLPFQYGGCYDGYHDKEGGFYQIYTHVFDSILEGERRGWTSEGNIELMANSYLSEVTFGDSSSPWSEVSAFYAAWEGFSSCLSYAWVDQYDVREAQNRRIRRAMEDENKKVRRISKRERNEDIANLVRFVKKRDPRVQQQKIKVEQERVEREEQIRMLAEKKKKEAHAAREAWRMESEEAVAQVEAEDLNAGRIRLADLSDHDDYFYQCGKKGRGKKKGNKKKGKNDNRVDDDAKENGGIDEDDTSTLQQQGQLDDGVESESNLVESAERASDSLEDPTHHRATGDVLDNENDSGMDREANTSAGPTPAVGSVASDNEYENEDTEEEEEEPDTWRCECCHKDFKSEGQLENHMKSKKHKESWKRYQKKLAQMEEQLMQDFLEDLEE